MSRLAEELPELFKSREARDYFHVVPRPSPTLGRIQEHEIVGLTADELRTLLKQRGFIAEHNALLDHPDAREYPQQ